MLRSLTCVLIGQPQSEVIGLGARVDHVDHREGRGEGVGDPLGVEDKVVMEEPRVSVEDFHLLLASLHHVRVTVTNMGHVIDTIKILNMAQLSGVTMKILFYRHIVLVVEILALAPDNLQGVRLVEQLARGPDVLLAQL